MKGTGIASGSSISAGFGAKGAPSFAGRPSAAGKVSVSLPGAEGRPSFATSFTSKSLAAHRSSPINREAISNSATRPSMFNINRPFSPNPISKPSEFGIKVSLKNGREVQSNKARTSNLAPQRPMFNTERKAAPEFGKRLQLGKIENVQKPRPVERSFVTPRRIDAQIRPIPREAHKAVAKRTSEAGFNPKVRSERVRSVRPDNMVNFWQKKDVSPRVKFETVARLGKSEQGTRTKQETRRVIKTLEEVRQNRKEAVRKIKRQKTEAPRRIKVGNRIKALPEMSQDVKNLVNADIKEAQKKAIYNIIAARGVTYEQALEEVVQELAKKHEGKVKIVPKPQAQVEAQTKTKSQVEVQAAVQVQPKTKAEVKPQTTQEQKKEKKPLMKKIFGKKTATEEYKLHFKKDEEANKKRLEKIKKAFEKLQKWSKHEITGADIIYEMGAQKEEEISELTRFQGVDYRLHGFMKAVKYMGEISDIKTFYAQIKKYASYYSAVKLAKEGEEESAVGQDAIEVYGRPLYKVPAYVADEAMEGRLTARGETIKVRVIKNGKEVIYHAPEEKELPQAA